MIHNPLLKALASIRDLLELMNVPYMIFGGIANSIYGNPRLTLDIDIKFILEEKNDLVPFLDGLGKLGKILPADPIEFVSETNVIPVDIDTVRVDLVLAELPFEKDAIHRSRSIDFFGIKINVCTPEDMIIQKAVSTREKDWADIQYIIENRGKDLDWVYLLKHCQELAEFLGDSEIYSRIKRWKNG